MKLWLLRPIGYPSTDPVLWHPWYDKAYGFVVRAETEEEARALAQADGGDETHEINDPDPAWTSPEYSTCVELVPDGEPGTVIRDFAAA